MYRRRFTSLLMSHRDTFPGGGAPWCGGTDIFVYVDWNDCFAPTINSDRSAVEYENHSLSSVVRVSVVVYSNAYSGCYNPHQLLRSSPSHTQTAPPTHALIARHQGKYPQKTHHVSPPLADQLLKLHNTQAILRDTLRAARPLLRSLPTPILLAISTSTSTSTRSCLLLLRRRLLSNPTSIDPRLLGGRGRIRGRR